MSENPDKSLDELVASRKLNADQKAQLEKKPAIRAQLAQLEDQLTHYRTFSQDLEERFAREKASLIESHEAEIAQLKEEAAANTKATDSKPDIQEALQVITHFLHAAASKRQSEDPNSNEARAFEGALLLVYQGNESSLATLRSLIEGADEKITDTQGELVDYTYAQIKQAALTEANPVEEETEAPPSYEAGGATDPTIANAGLTELQDTTTIPVRTNGTDGTDATFAVPEQASAGDNAANAVAESKWDPEASVHTEASAAGEDWVNVPRDPAETDTGLQATPAAAVAEVQNSNSWADEVEATPIVSENDGFEQVKGRHSEHRGRGRGRGGRGDGFRGRGRGGQRGEFRGGRGRGGDARGRGGQRGGDRG